MRHKIVTVSVRYILVDKTEDKMIAEGTEKQMQNLLKTIRWCGIKGHDLRVEESSSWN